MRNRNKSGIKTGDHVRVTAISDPAIGSVNGKAGRVIDVFKPGVIVEFQIPAAECKTAFFEFVEVKKVPSLISF